MDVMGIATLSMHMAQQNIMQEVNVSLMRNAMDHMEQTGQMLAQMMQSIPSPVPPAGFDGVGGVLDVMM
ncbi:MAG: YjfB family protein [Clostridiales bacterium]|jgi:hypothetical protein|nr:YjfB family protein [Clostridiales bacterium]